MTKNVTRDPEYLAAWPDSGRCWKIVAYKHCPHELQPFIFGERHNYSEWGAWQTRYVYHCPGFEMPGFHCFATLDDAHAAMVDGFLPDLFGEAYIQEFEYEGLEGIGQFVLNGEPRPVLLVEHLKPLSYVTISHEAQVPTEERKEVTPVVRRHAEAGVVAGGRGPSE